MSLPGSIPRRFKNKLSARPVAQFALGLRLGEPGSGGSEAVVSSMEGTNLLAASRTWGDPSDRAISASRRFTETVWLLH